MLTTRSVVSTVSTLLMILATGVASGQTTSTSSGQAYPNKPIRLITGTVGSGIDLVTRLVAQGISGPLGQPVVVDNRPSNLLGEIVAKAPPDGYTLLLTGGSFLLGPLLQKTPYDPVSDFSPISLNSSSPNAVVVHPSLPVKSIKELIALAGARPGALNYASSGTGSGSHLTGELFKSMAGVKLVNVNYKGGALALNALMGGEVELMFPSAGTLAPHLKSGRLRALAVTSTQPSALVPGLTTVAASGLPGYESVSLDFIYAPAKTSEAIIRRLNQEFVQFLRQADVKEKYISLGVEAVSSSPEGAAATIKSELARWGKVIKDAGIKAE